MASQSDRPAMPDCELVERMSGRDERALGELYDRHGAGNSYRMRQHADLQ